MNKNNSDSNNENESYLRERISQEIAKKAFLEGELKKLNEGRESALLKATVTDDLNPNGCGEEHSDVSLGLSEGAHELESDIHDADRTIAELKAEFLSTFGKEWNA